MNFLKLIRWPNLMIMAFVMVLLRYFLIVPQFEMAGIMPGSTVILFILLIFSVLSIAAGGYVINDILDMDIDAVNRPQSLLISKKINIVVVKIFYLLLTLAGICVGLYLAWLANNYYFGLIFPVMAALLYYYSKRYKRRLISGNIVVSVASAMVLVVTWNFELFLLKNDAVQLADNMGVTSFISRFVYGYTFFAFFTSLIREIVKDMEDVEGDKAAGCATIPLTFGFSASKVIVLVLVLLLMACVGWWQYLLYLDGFYICSGFLFSSQIVAVFILYKLFLIQDHAGMHLISTMLKILMISGISSIVLLNV